MISPNNNLQKVCLNEKVLLDRMQAKTIIDSTIDFDTAKKLVKITTEERKYIEKDVAMNLL